MIRRSTRILIALASLVAILAAGAIVAFFWLWQEREEPEPPLTIPRSWQEVREGPGHLEHEEVRCRECHEDFETDRRTACNACHEEELDRIHAGQEKCLDCHPFRPGVDLSKGCFGCHQEVAFSKHDACTTCHPPHQELKTCAGCHEEPQVAGHEDCETCHPPHQPSRRVGCASCHRGIELTHADRGRANACTACHPAHRTAPACSACHQAARSDRGFHAGAECVECHRPHDFARSLGCAVCHAPEAAEAARAKGHAKCAACHRTGAHEPATPAVACAKCHAEEHRSAPEGHRSCKDCHQLHSGALIPGSACGSCHPEQADDAHAKAGCAACHQPHALTRPPKPTGCTSCHDASGLRLLHTNRGHARCDACHRIHAKERPDLRKTCLACHRAQRDHEPNARYCGGCHPF